MCLSVIYKGKQKAEALAKLPDVVTGWAVVEKIGGKYYPYYFSNTPFRAGTNKAAQPIVCGRHYRAGFHRFLSRNELIEEMGTELRLSHRAHQMTCKIHKKDITTIGEQQGKLCVVAKQITCPKYCGKKGD